MYPGGPHSPRDPPVVSPKGDWGGVSSWPTSPFELGCTSLRKHIYIFLQGHQYSVSKENTNCTRSLFYVCIPQERGWAGAQNSL